MKKLALAILIALGTTGVQAAVELKLGHFASDTHPCGIAAKDFKANVEKRTNGEVKIALYGNNVLGSPPEVLEQVLLGAVDMSLSGQDQLAKHLPFYDVISTPFAFKDYATADKIIDGDFKAWAAPELLKKNLVHLSDWEWGFRQLTNSKKPILTPADMKGMKIRTPPAFAYQAFVEAAGGNAQTIAFAELGHGDEAGRGRRPGKPDRHDLRPEAVRNAEVHVDPQLHLQFDGPRGQQEELGTS